MKMTSVLVCVAFIGIAGDIPHAEDFTFDSDGTEIFYSIDGKGETVVLIHGAGATGAINWRLPRIVQMLSANYRVITMDVRGHGKSGKPNNGAVGVAAVEDVRRLLDHLNLEKAHLVGYSMGGMISLKMIAEHPERVQSAVIGGMGWYEHVERPNSPISGRGFGELGTTAEEMKGINVPLVVIVGSQDVGQNKRIERWKTVTPDLEVINIEGANHANCMFKPDFKKALQAFLDEQPKS
jgi:predicted alpha/beta-hydrolase family hydrolase